MEKQIVNRLHQLFSAGKPLEYGKNEVILRAEDNPQGVYLLESGYVRMCRVLEDGRELTFNIFKPGSFFPMMWVIGNISNNYDFHTMTQVKLKRLSKEKVLELVKSDPDIFMDLMKRVLIGLDGILTNIEYLLSGSAYKRVISVLLLSAKRFGEGDGQNKIKINLPLTHQDIANICGLTRETVSLEIAALYRKKLISGKSSTLTILDIVRIKEEAGIYKDEVIGTPAL